LINKNNDKSTKKSLDSHGFLPTPSLTHEVVVLFDQSSEAIRQTDLLVASSTTTRKIAE
jgi:hypothetical protein